MNNDLSNLRLKVAQCLYETWEELNEIQPFIEDDMALRFICGRMRAFCVESFFKTTGRHIYEVISLFELSTEPEVREITKRLTPRG